ncbi:unnamed protein product, partial [Ilex paraguariensis]
MPYKRWCFGSSHGQLFIMKKPMIITLSNPLNGRTIHLPEFKDLSNDYQYWIDKDDNEYFICKGILSTDPSQDAKNYEVVVIYGGMKTLASFKSGDEAWTFLDFKKDYLFSDVIYYEGRLHGVTERGGHICANVIN